MNNRERGKSGFIKQIIGCLTSPRSSFKSILEKASLKKATAVILLIAIVAALASSNYMSKLPQTYQPDQGQRGLFPGQGNPVNPEQLRQALVTMTAMTALIGVFATWLISSALTYGFSRSLGGEGTFKSMLTLAGYASAPLLIQQILRLAHSFMISQEEVLQLVTSLRISAYPPLNIVANAFVDTFTIFRLWSIGLLIIAIRENYEISTARSVVATASSFIIIALISSFFPLT
jgi:hypothetical protein